MPAALGGIRALVWVLALLLAQAVAHAEPEPESIPEPPSLRVFTAKKIVTMEPSLPEATAVAVEHGRIVAVGTLESLRPLLADRPHEVDETFAGKVLLPGLIDAHAHPILAGILLPMSFVTADDWHLPGREIAGVRGRDAYLARLRELEGTMKDSEAPLFVWGYDPLFHGDVARADLDAISTTRPIIAWHRDFHEIYANTPALAWLEVTADAASHYPANDFERGHLAEGGLALVFERLGPFLLNPARIRGGLELAREAIHRGGVTTIADMATGLFDLELEWSAMRETLADLDAPFRTYMVPDGRSLVAALGAQGAYNLIESLPDRNGARLRFLRAVKFYADGSFFSQRMQVGPPGYLDGHRGEWVMTPEQLAYQAQPYWNAGYQIHVHTDGGAAVGATLDVLQRFLDEHPRFDHRFTLHHVGLSTTAQIRRAKALGALLSFNPFYVWARADAYALQGLGPERAAQIARLGTAAREGVPISLHSDFTLAPAEPLFLVETAVTRRTAGGQVVAPAERLTLDQALRAVTIDAAYTLRLDDQIGSIAAGKKADFTVLEQDPYAVPPEKLSEIPIWGTVLEGRPFPIDMASAQADALASPRESDQYKICALTG